MNTIFRKTINQENKSNSITMKKQELEKEINALIERTFCTITNLYEGKDGKTRLSFPHHTHGVDKDKQRVSEQELRQLFIEELNRYADEKRLSLKYSIEVPTRMKYRFPKDGDPKVCEDGVSGRFDLTIWLDGKMVSIIEFKEGNATCNSYKKDLCKLMNEDEGEEDTLRYFVNILEDSNKKTVESIDGKFRDYIKGRKTIHLWILSMGIHRQRNRFVKQIVY